MELVERALDGADVALAHLGVSRGGAGRAKAKQQLNQPDVGAILEHVSGKACLNRCGVTFLRCLALAAAASSAIATALHV